MHARESKSKTGDIGGIGLCTSEPSSRTGERTRRGAYIKAGVTAARAWTNRESVWSSAFFFPLYFIHSFSPSLHTDSPLSGHALCSHGLTARVGSRSRALRLQRGMHARIAYSTMRPDQPRSAAFTPSRQIKIDPMDRNITISNLVYPLMFTVFHVSRVSLTPWRRRDVARC